MNPSRLLAILLIAGGVLALVYGGFSYPKQTQAARIGPVELTVQENKRVNIPVWAGVGAIVVGVAVLVMGGRKS